MTDKFYSGFPSREEIEKLNSFLAKSGLKGTRTLFQYLGLLTHSERLTANLRVVMQLEVIGTNNTSITRLLSKEELSAINELHKVSANTELKEIANSLLNIKERCLMAKALDRMFRAAKEIDQLENR